MSAPVVPVWDGSVTWLAEQARQRLRLSETDPDLSYLALLSQSICDQVTNYLDPVGGQLPWEDVVPAPVTTACLQAVVEAYGRKDARFGLYSAWSGEGVANRISADWLGGVYDALRPHKARFGVA